MSRNRVHLVNALSITESSECPNVEGWRMAIRIWLRITEKYDNQVFASTGLEINTSSKENPEVPKFTPFQANGRAMREISGRAGPMGEISLGGAE